MPGNGVPHLLGADSGAAGPASGCSGHSLKMCPSDGQSAARAQRYASQLSNSSMKMAWWRQWSMRSRALRNMAAARPTSTSLASPPSKHTRRCVSIVVGMPVPVGWVTMQCVRERGGPSPRSVTRTKQSRRDRLRPGGVGRRTPEVYRTLTQQAAMTIRQLTDLVDAHGLHAAITIGAGKAEQRNRGRRMVEANRRLVGHYKSMGWRRGSGMRETQPAGGVDMPPLAPAGRHGW